MSADRTVLAGAKFVAYGAIWGAGLITLLRGIVGPLWGSASDFGLVGAVLAFAGGILALAWLLVIMARDIQKTLSTPPETPHE